MVLFHTNHSIFGVEKYWVDQPFGQVFEFGHAGVYFFFVLSGFIIYAAHRRDIGDDSRIGAFMWKRFRRIYPVYWVLMLTIVPLYFLFPTFGIGIERQPGVIVDSFSLVHLFGGGATVLTAAWTLFHELLFYGVFCTLILNRRAGTVILGLWLVACAATLLPGMSLPAGLEFYFSPLHLLFGMGMAVAWIVARGPIPAPWTVGLAGIVVFFGAGAAEVTGSSSLSPDLLALVYGAGSVMIVLGAVQLEQNGALRMPKLLVFLGDASYSIYLVHFVALSVMAKLALVATHYVALPHMAIYVGLAVASVGAGVAYHLLVEVPLLSLMGQRATARRTALPAMASDLRSPT